MSSEIDKYSLPQEYYTKAGYLIDQGYSDEEVEELALKLYLKTKPGDYYEQ